MKKHLKLTTIILLYYFEYFKKILFDWPTNNDVFKIFSFCCMGIDDNIPLCEHSTNLGIILYILNSILLISKNLVGK